MTLKAEPLERSTRSGSMAAKRTQLCGATLRTAPRVHMLVAFQQRRQQIVGDCTQLKSDVDSYNQNWAKSEPIQMVFDFRRDVEERQHHTAA